MMFQNYTDSFLIISRGVYDIFVQKDGVSVCVGKYNNKGSFGELALMYNTPRAATIIATEEGALWGLVSVTKVKMALSSPVSITHYLMSVLKCYRVVSGSGHISQTDCEK